MLFLFADRAVRNKFEELPRQVYARKDNVQSPSRMTHRPFHHHSPRHSLKPHQYSPRDIDHVPCARLQETDSALR